MRVKNLDGKGKAAKMLFDSPVGREAPPQKSLIFISEFRSRP